MILVLAGTGDARELALRLRSEGYGVWTTVVTEQAADRLREVGLPVRVGRLDPAGFRDAIRETHTRLVVDASHPFAEEASRSAMAGAREADVPYIRYERPHRTFGNQDAVTLVPTYEEAAREAAGRSGVILLTTGSKTLPLFARHLLGRPGITLAVRLLPRAENLALCEHLGIDPRYILAMQGPFSRELNEALFRHLGVTVLVSKESGSAGAVDEKVEAALAMGLGVILIARPQVNYGTVLADAEAVVTHLRSWKEEFRV